MRREMAVFLLTLSLILLLLAGCGKASPSKLEKVTFHSPSLQADMKMSVYLPDGYSTSKKYPVLYILHGYTGDEKGWMPGLGMDKKADELIEKNKIKPMIIVAPEIDNSYGINSSSLPRALGGTPETDLSLGLYEDYLYKDVISYIDSHYSTDPSREGRYIGGLSMGGFAALHLAFNHTDLFSKVGGHSPALFMNGNSGRSSAWLYPDDTTREERDPIFIAEKKDLKSLKVYLDCGDQDSYQFYQGSGKLYLILKEKGVDVQFHQGPGGHDAEYWTANVEKYLLFYGGE